MITIIAAIAIGGIVYAGIDAYQHPSEANTTELWDDDEFYYSKDENGNVKSILKSDTITIPSGYAVIKDGHIVDFIFDD